jgi:hypothetical protein
MDVSLMVLPKETRLSVRPLDMRERTRELPGELLRDMSVGYWFGQGWQSEQVGT